MPQIQGYNKETSIRGEWYAFAIQEEGKQYPKKLETKKAEIIQAALAAGQQVAVWTFNESEGGPNPHRPGTNYVNRYLEGVQVGGQLSVQPQAAPVTQAPVAGAAAPVVQQGATAGGRSPDERMSIERQTIVKAVMPLYPVGAIGDEAALFALMARLDAFITGVSHPRGQGPGFATSPTAGDPGSDAPLRDDDDIPF